MFRSWIRTLPALIVRFESPKEYSLPRTESFGGFLGFFVALSADAAAGIASAARAATIRTSLTRLTLFPGARLRFRALSSLIGPLGRRMNPRTGTRAAVLRARLLAGTGLPLQTVSLVPSSRWSTIRHLKR